MKKIISILTVITLLFAFSACSNRNQNKNEIQNTELQTQLSENTSTNLQDGSVSFEKALVVYFSVPETTSPNNMTQEEDNSVVVIDGEVLGNTQYVAKVIQENTGAELFRIEPKTPYTTIHEDLVNLAKEEQNSNARPEIKDNIENFEQYDTVFVGYPNWWGDMPMIMYTFFDTYDFSGKTVIPFNTHGGSGFSNTINAIKELEPNANVNDNGYTVSRNNVQEAESEIIQWLKDIGFTKPAKNNNVNITLTVGNQIINAVLDNSETAKAFTEMLPLTISVKRVGGGREFYGAINNTLPYNYDDAQTTFENGDIALWLGGNGVCLLYNNQVDKPDIEDGIVVFGKITSDLSVFYNMNDNEQITIESAQ